MKNEANQPAASTLPGLIFHSRNRSSVGIKFLRTPTDQVAESFAGKITVSVGVASYPEDGSNREDLFSLYKAKSMGKNRVCHSISENS